MGRILKTECYTSIKKLFLDEMKKIFDLMQKCFKARLLITQSMLAIIILNIIPDIVP